MGIVMCRSVRPRFACAAKCAGRSWWKILDNVITVFPGGVLSREQVSAFNAFAETIAAAINEVKSADVPQGLIVAILHGHAHQETRRMMDDG